MRVDTKTVGDGPDNKRSYDPMDSLKAESVDRMKAALLAASLDDPLSSITAIRQVTLLRVHHQVSRIVQYLDLMDKLESKLYDSIENVLNEPNFGDENFSTVTKLLAIQEKLQKSIIESNKLLAPYLDMEQYPAFTAVDASTPVQAEILEIPATQRNALRENAGAIISELKLLESSSEPVVGE